MLEPSYSDTVTLEPYQHQVGGHSVVLHYDKTTICKPLNKREQHFYVTLPEDLKQFTAEYRGVIDVKLAENDHGLLSFLGFRRNIKNESLLDPLSGSSSPASSGSENELSSDTSPQKYSKQKQRTKISFKHRGSLEISCHADQGFESAETGKLCSHSAWGLRCHKMLVSKWRKQGQTISKFILLENVASHFKQPCVLDLKMGTRQHGDDASEKKQREHTAKCLSSTSSKLGVRVCGMQVYQVDTETYISQDKYFGRSLDVDGFHDSIQQFLHNGHRVRLDLIQDIIAKLTKLKKVLKDQDSFRFYSCSLLIMYDGIESGTKIFNNNSGTYFNSAQNHKQSQSSNGSVVVKIIDFAHTTHRGFKDDEKHYEGPDKGFILGLGNLIKAFHSVEEKCLR
ncbi:hypothetical protein LOTGIDRAFT_112151 [Lottia gigantea]|uniref:Kinase n=1 Tax=Lottia gigantea TaxID=225164 RepID=V4AZP8_LOTGI|nr:hypothetical protein LOTGIDRAFT_112151 [Lottia gigantea]ESP00626.1 hypothetical protein LOTGIDRAFT_112151 [Lottia gigantea]